MKWSIFKPILQCFKSKEGKFQYKPNSLEFNFWIANKVMKHLQSWLPFHMALVMGRTSFFKHRMNSNVFICWWLNLNTLFLASNDRTSNFEPNRAFTTFNILLIELTQTSFFWTSNELKRVHLIVIDHPIFGLEHRTSNIVRPITIWHQWLCNVWYD